MPNFDIQIRSLKAICNERASFSGWHVVSIRDVGPSRSKEVEQEKLEQYEFLDSFASTFGSMIILHFDDVWLPQHKGQVPTEEDVRGVLEWAKNKNQIVVHCGAGISRSSAMAYVIACQKLGVDEAIKKLNFLIHSPNPLVVAFGAIILENIRVVDECSKMENAFRKLFIEKCAM